jgi:hypothetical protein
MTLGRGIAIALGEKEVEKGEIEVRRGDHAVVKGD